MHDQTTHRTLFNPFGYSRFRATSCTLRFYVGIGAEHVAHPQGEAQILVIEKEGEYLKIKSAVGVKHF